MHQSTTILKVFLDSERSNEYIDFTMLCTLGVVFDSKIYLVGALGMSFFEFSNNFQKHQEKPKKN